VSWVGVKGVRGRRIINRREGWREEEGEGEEIRDVWWGGVVEKEVWKMGVERGGGWMSGVV
jgi:hypothetical protein